MTRRLPGINVQHIAQGEGMRLLPPDFNERHGGTVPGPDPAVGFGKGCRCDWLGQGTPGHAPSALCISLRPDADRESALPDPTVTGPCQVQATFLCTQEAAGMRLIPTSMLPDALIPGPLYAPMCLPCYEHLSTVYLTELHRGDQS